MTTEDMKSLGLSNGADEQLRTIKKQKKKKMTGGEQIHEDGSLETDLKSNKKKKKSKKRTSSDLDSREESRVNAGQEAIHEEDGEYEYDMNEPTMEEKLASLDLVVENKPTSIVNQEQSPAITPPSADSIHVLLKQALHADDHTLLLDCLYSRDDKVIAKSISLLNPSDVLKLLQSLISVIRQRGAVVVCALPWLRSLLSQHASSIASQESSLLILNSLYQIIDTRVSTYQSALQLSTCLDVLTVRIPDNEVDEESREQGIVYEVEDSEEEEEDGMETEEDNDDMGAIIDSYDSDGSEVMSD